jgi:uncharacterized membrane protein YdbT with pleckstrin-like domain
MSYIQDNLMPNEKILFSARVSTAIFIPACIPFVATCFFAAIALSAGSKNDVSQGIYAFFLILIAIMFFILTIRYGLEALITILTTEFAVTNRRVIAKTGFFHRHTLEMLLPKIESVAVYQNIMGRLFNFGSVTVTGTGGTKEKFRAIVEPVAVRSKINQIIEYYMQANVQQQKAVTPGTVGN